MALLEGLDDFDWTAVPGPKWYRPSDVPSALRALASNPEGRGDVTSQALFAFGNNHAGTYYPVVLPALPFLRQILEHGDRSARMATMAVLEELTYFEPEFEFTTVVGPDGAGVALANLFERSVLGLRDALTTITSSASDEAELQLARGLLTRLTELESER